MDAGKLDRRITIERKVVTQDPTYGTELIAWTTVADRVPAEIQDALPSRAESVVLGAGVARSQTRCRLRWRGDIDSSMRVTVHGDTDVIYQIVGGPAEIGGRKDGLELVLERYSS
jgi:head-tail adaptor